MQPQDARIVLVTTPDVETARGLAHALVEERLAACGNVVQDVISIYRWQGAVEEAGEALLVLKTSRERLAALSARVLELHPYEVPEVLAFGIDAGHQPYLDWLGASVASGGSQDGSQG